MPNTTLPTNVTTGTTGRIAQTNIVHDELNRMTRDTGWRNLLPVFRNGWTASRARIRRYDERVKLHIEDLDGTAATGPEIVRFGADLSTNFAPEVLNPAAAWRLPTIQSLTDNWEVVMFGTASYIGARTVPTTGRAYSGLLMYEWSTFKAWPTALPPAA